MATEIVVRGNTVEFQTTFYDTAGALLSPATATLYINYPIGAARASASVAMTAQSDGTWIATWESNVSDAGRVDWTASTDGTTPFAVEDGFLQITANRSNPGPVSA